MQFLSALVISLSALAAAAPMPLDKASPSRQANPSSGSSGDNIVNTAVIPPECASLKDIWMSCPAPTDNSKTSTQQCNYTDAAGKPATKSTIITCTSTTRRDPTIAEIAIDEDE